MDFSQISLENVASVVGVGIATAWIAFHKYKASVAGPTTAKESEDLALLAGSITDMRPVRNIEAHIKRQADAQERTATAMEKIAGFMGENAAQDAIERRAVVLAEEMRAAERRRNPRERP